MTQDELLERARDGDSRAFAELFRAHRSDVARLIHRMQPGSRSEIEDLVQEVFLQVHRSLKDFRGQSRFSTWLYRITVNVVLMYRRSRRARPVYADETEGAPPRDGHLPPDELAARNARVAAFYRLLDQLSEKKRQVFVLHELEGISPGEIARIVGAPTLTVRTRLFYARKELAQLFRREPTLANLAALFERERGVSGKPGEESNPESGRATKEPTT